MSEFTKRRLENLKPQLLAAPWNFDNLDELVEEGRKLGVLDRMDERRIHRLDLEHRILQESDPVRRKRLEAALSVYQALDGEIPMEVSIQTLEKSRPLHKWKVIDGKPSSS
ncbi:hypothetical protein [Alcanivorax sp.]|uniref:hypothetical protein n=1 Tax=Alcanivorax sp. TaxID=1872427 RepID=UPI0025905953|nr:hypothetical protein [Alcanivorax sp.]